MHLTRRHKGRKSQDKVVEKPAAVRSLMGYREDTDFARDMAVAERILRLVEAESSCWRDMLVAGCTRPVRVVSGLYPDYWDEGYIRHDHEHIDHHIPHRLRDLWRRQFNSYLGSSNDLRLLSASRCRERSRLFPISWAATAATPAAAPASAR